MSKKSSFREALERREGAREGSPGKSASPTHKLLLTARDISQPVDFARLLIRYGLSLRKAHDVLDKLAFGRSVAVELSAQNDAALRSELSKIGVNASIIGPPDVDVKKVRERFGLSQSEFAARYPFELDTIQNWEQGRTRPDAISRTLLKVIEENPAVVEDVLIKRTSRKPARGQ
jgi:DNA-binding transcriptional regulator YiaG